VTIFILSHMNKKILIFLSLLLLLSMPLLAQEAGEAIGGGVPDTGFSFISLLRGLLGISVLVGLGYLFSSHRKAIAWKVIGTGLAAQFLIAIIVLKVPFFQYVIGILGKVFLKILDFTQEGTSFLLRSFISDLFLGHSCRSSTIVRSALYCTNPCAL